jgi:hypothetical protein
MATHQFVCFDHTQKYDPDFDAADSSSKSDATTMQLRLPKSSGMYKAMVTLMSTINKMYS